MDNYVRFASYFFTITYSIYFLVTVSYLLSQRFISLCTVLFRPTVHSLWHVTLSVHSILRCPLVCVCVCVLKKLKLFQPVSAASCDQWQFPKCSVHKDCDLWHGHPVEIVQYIVFCYQYALLLDIYLLLRVVSFKLSISSLVWFVYFHKYIVFQHPVSKTDKKT